MSNFDSYIHNQYSNQPWNFLQNTNVNLVTSLEEALMRTNMRNSDMVYFHQDQNVFYRVKVDQDGRKSWMQFNYQMPDPNANVPATKADLLDIENRLRRLEDGKLNGSSTIQSGADESGHTA